MTSNWVLIDLEIEEPDTRKSSETWTLHSDKKLKRFQSVSLLVECAPFELPTPATTSSSL